MRRQPCADYSKASRPDARQIYWKWVGGMFALYVVLMLTAAGVFVGHESSRKLAQEPAATVAIDGKPRSIAAGLRRRCGRPREIELVIGVQTPIALRATTSR